MKVLNFCILAIFVSFFSVSCMRIDCGEAPITKSYSGMAGFNAVDVSHAFDVNMVPSDREAVELMIPPDAAKYVVVRQKGKTLYIGMKSGHTYRLVNDRECCFKATVHFRELKEVTASGASEVDIEGLYDARNQNLTVSLSGASSFDGKLLNVDKMTVTLSGASSFAGEAFNVNGSVMNLSGASELEMKGNANDMDLELSGASEAELYGFPVKTFEGTFSGASEAGLTVTETFSGSASGASTIKVKGRPTVLKAKESGASSIIFE